MTEAPRTLTPEEREHRLILKECLRGFHYGRGAARIAEMVRGDRIDEDAMVRLYGHYHWIAPSPATELLTRLNDRIRGRDPGKPVNWRGI